ncbi:MULTISPECIES: carbamoyltransferase C-terminal domain-containing protein [Spirulina sp. CCY15215]|uniref:carbamoyltransferase family protein n=1 Tax=Spirulina sp. CCY15215 TaxID=2767591 RepID=UPI00194F5FBD|nr:carbamoyltransferase C-terminal domain-containing protein [Spirulina major]
MVDSNSYILGINCVYHESSACLLKDGQIIAAVEEERFTRVKHAKLASVDNPDILPVNAISFCLKEADITWNDINFIGYSFEPKKWATQLDKSATIPGERKEGWGTIEGEEIFEGKLKDIPYKLSQLAQEDIADKFLWLPHHLCHAGSAYFVSPYSEAAVLVVDGIGEVESTTLYRGKDNILSEIEAIACYPDSLGTLWETISVLMGFSKYDATKVMGLAAYGKEDQEYLEMFKTFVKVQGPIFTIDPEVLQDNDFTDDCSELENLFGLQKRKLNEKLEQKHADIALALQNLTDIILLNIANYLYDRVQSPNLCLAGGVALNCVSNQILQEKSPFKNLYIQPAAHDAGTAIGAAYCIWNQTLRKPRSYIMKTPYLGPDYSSEEIQTVLDRNQLQYSQVDNIEEMTAKLISEGNVIGWFQGKMEIGPRALGNRSLVADPRNPNMREIMNQKVKHREDFRPFAPSVLEEYAQDWFKLPGDSLALGFMLFACSAIEDKQSLIPAILHVDGTSRVQVVNQQLNPKYHRLIQAFYQITGVPLVLNTSFNDTEPIVCSPEDAVKTFLKTKIDYLAIGDFLVRK